MNVFSLFASLKLDASDYKQGINDAKKEGKNFAETTKNEISPTAVAGWTAIATAVIAVIKQIHQLMLDTMNYADSVGDLAAQFGVSSSAISEMQYIADQSSTSVEQLTTSMSMLYMRAKQDGDAFKQLGVSVKDNNGNFKAMDELFWETAEALNSLEDDGAKSAYMLDLFGRSAMNVGEVLRKSSGELTAMRQEAHELGIVMSNDTINFASDMNDAFAVLKLQAQSALASLIIGEDGAEEKLQNFIDSVISMLDTYIPTFVSFALKLLVQIAIAWIKIAPSFMYEIYGALLNAIFDINWFQVGVDIGKATAEGIINEFISVFNMFSGLIGIKAPKVNFDVGKNLFTAEDVGSEYEISENINQTIEVKVEAIGDTAVSQESAEKTAEALAPYIDKILGGK